MAAVSNVTIRNGTIANNGYGVFFAFGTNSINHILENLVVTRCYIVGIYFAGATTGCLIQNNQLSQIGNSTNSANVHAYGIYTNGGARVEGNAIIGVTPVGTGQGIGIYASAGDIMLRNVVSNAPSGIVNGK